MDEKTHLKHSHSHHLTPTTLRGLRSFLSLSGYYRRFVLDYAKLAKPFTSLLGGGWRRITCQPRSKFIAEALDAFNKIKSSLVSKGVMLAFPKFEQDPAEWF